MIRRSLNPNKPEIRKFCQKLATSSMKSLLKRYTFCAFHKDTQHFFVPGAHNEIIIYDLRTAMRWKSLKGHDSLIEGLAVQEPGNILASFSRVQKEIKLWKVAPPHADRGIRFLRESPPQQHRALQEDPHQRGNPCRH